MPETLSALLGGVEAGGKKKLKKQGDYWIDEQGNQYLDEEGTQPVKGTAQNTVSALDFFNKLKEDPQSTGSAFTGELTKKNLSAMEPKKQDEGPADEEGDSLYDQYSEFISKQYNMSKADWRRRWAQWDPEARKKTKEFLARGSE